jgi:tetratricopeptide (TPR) repeat protein
MIRGAEGTQRTPRKIFSCFYLCVLCALCVDSALISQSRVPDAQTVAEIRQLAQSGQAAAAQEQLNAFDPANPLVIYLRGLAFYHADDHAKAIEVLTPVASRLEAGSLERREAEQVLGLALYGAGRLNEALPYLEATRAWAPDNVELHYFLGLTYLQTGKIDAARGAFAVTFGVPLAAAAADLVTAQMLIRLNLDDAAEAELKRALDKDSRLPQARFLLGQMALFRGKLKEAAEFTRGELDVNPGNAMAWYQLGDVLVRESKWQDAIAMLQRSLWINPFYSGPYILLGQAYMRTGQPATAEGMLRRAIQYDPNNRAAHYLLAQLLQQLKRTDEAKAEFAIAEKLQGQPGRP